MPFCYVAGHDFFFFFLFMVPTGTRQTIHASVETCFTECVDKWQIHGSRCLFFTMVKKLDQSDNVHLILKCFFHTIMVPKALYNDMWTVGARIQNNLLNQLSHRHFNPIRKSGRMCLHFVDANSHLNAFNVGTFPVKTLVWILLAVDMRELVVG